MLRLRGAGRTFPGPPEVRALAGVDLDVAPGGFLAIVGPSGGGKSTLLNVVGLLERPDSGRYAVNGIPVADLDDDGLARCRSDTFSFVFQGFHLLDRRPVLDSVGLGLLYRGVPRAERDARARDALERLGIGVLVAQPAHLLSGGERQRVAIARALATGSPVVLADEPTGNLDSGNAERVVDALEGLVGEGTTVVLVTHSPEVAARADRRIRLRDGRVVETEGDRADVADHAPASVASPPGRASTLRVRDLIVDAAGSLAARRGRTAGLLLAVAVAVGLAVGSSGVATSARAQVSATFDAHANRDVTAQWTPGEASVAQEATDLAGRLRELPGVEEASIVDDEGPHAIGAIAGRPRLTVPVFRADAALPAAARLTLKGGRPAPSDGALVGANLAGQLGVQLGPGSVVLLDGVQVEVTGVIARSPRWPELLGSVVLLDPDRVVDLGRTPPVRRIAVIAAGPGAAQQIAGQVPFVIDPVRPEAIEVFAPVDPGTLRGEVESDVFATLLAFTAVAALASTLGLANAMTVAVLERQADFGLRRAVGARRRHIAALILTEAVMVGCVGGIVGLLGGTLVILAITILNRWAPVLEPLTAPLALVGGVVVGALGGAVAAVRASRIQPAQALRL